MSTIGQRLLAEQIPPSPGRYAAARPLAVHLLQIQYNHTSIHLPSGLAQPDPSSPVMSCTIRTTLLGSRRNTTYVVRLCAGYPQSSAIAQLFSSSPLRCTAQSALHACTALLFGPPSSVQPSTAYPAFLRIPPLCEYYTTMYVRIV